MFGLLVLLLAACEGAAEGPGYPGVPGNSGSGSPPAGSTQTAPTTPESLVVPLEVGKNFRFTAGELVLEVNPELGGRITTLALGGVNLIADANTTGEPSYWGSTLWVSPQSRYGIDIAELDNKPYSAAVTDGHLILTGQVDPAWGLRAIKDLAVETSGRIVFGYTIESTRSTLELAPWQVTRVPRLGLVYYPTGTTRTGPLSVIEATGTTWFDPVSSPSSTGKLIADGTRGWLAYVQDTLLFLHQFRDLEPTEQAPGEGEVEIYAASRYLELEVQGPYSAISPGSALKWSITWRLSRLPAELLPVAIGNPSLVEFTDQLAL